MMRQLKENTIDYKIDEQKTDLSNYYETLYNAVCIEREILKDRNIKLEKKIKKLKEKVKKLKDN